MTEQALLRNRYRALTTSQWPPSNDDQVAISEYQTSRLACAQQMD